MTKRDWKTVAGILSLCLSTVFLISCADKNSESKPIAQAPKRASVSDQGKMISFPAGSPGLQQFTVSAAAKGTTTVCMTAPARIVATIASGSNNAENRAVLFESSDVTSLYSSYRQGKSNLIRADKNLARTKDMYANQAATAKDLTDAENDAATAQANLNEMDVRLRALGFKPTEIDTAPSGTVWIIADVPESQLNEVQKGETVTITLLPFPDQKFSGKAEAIGDIVDPATRTVKVRVTLPNRSGKLLPGMFARVDFGAPEKAVIVLPVTSVVTVEGKNYVFVETATGEFQRREVTLSNSNSTEAIILDGIKDGEKVVTSGTMLLKGLSFGH